MVWKSHHTVLPGLRGARKETTAGAIDRATMRHAWTGARRATVIVGRCEHIRRGKKNTSTEAAIGEATTSLG
ncbi:MAG TPA: hypothetical protein VGT61_05660 [Thermomicrobiales bacterium]|jgi:hypothetical protein|nr:hypothetical protein [Thermomicrobiales bacterium]